MIQSSSSHQEGTGYVNRTVSEALATTALCEPPQEVRAEQYRAIVLVRRQRQSRKSGCTCVGSRNAQKEHLLGDTQLQRLFWKEKNWTDLDFNWDPKVLKTISFSQNIPLLITEASKQRI